MLNHQSPPDKRLPAAMSLGGFAVAMVGAYIAFLPLLQILLPIKAASIAPGDATALLGKVAASGAAVAGIANIAIGWLSDRTRSRFGRRRPWILAGLFGIAVSDEAIRQSHTVVTLILAFALFQLTFNMMFSPLLALVSDRVAETRRGWAAALVGLGKPVGTIIGTIVIGSLLAGEAERFLALGAMTLASIAPFAIRLSAEPLAAVQSAVRIDVPAATRRQSGNFALAWLSRICIVMAFTVAQLYLLFYLEAVVPNARPHDVALDITWLAVVFGVVSALAGIIAGRLSDRAGLRKPLVLVSALAIAAAMAALAAAPSWPAAVAAYAFFAIGAGVHTAVELAMIVEILPARDRAARDLGILNLSNIVPQIVAPLAVTWIVSFPGSSIQSAFGASAVAAATGAMLIAFMRGVR